LNLLRLVAASVVAAAAASTTVNAGCPGSRLIDATFHYLVSNPDWGGTAGGDGSCGYLGCYDFQSGPPVSSSMRGVFWALGSGNPVIGLGNDNGNFRGGFGPGDFWPKQRSQAFTYGVYHYPAWISLNLRDNFDVGPPVTWSSPDADGCGPANPPASVCTCMLLSDQWEGVGYFATLGAASNALGNTRFDTGGASAFRLAPIPTPEVIDHVPDPVQEVLHFNLRANSPTGGRFEKDGCVQAGGPYTQIPGSNDLASRACGLLSTSLADGDPGPDHAAFVLVTGETGAIESSLGTTSAGAERPNTLPCP